MEMKINLYNAELSLKVMHTYFVNKDIQKQTQITVPKSIILYSATHYCYLFYNCLINYGIKSNILHENLLRLYEQRPNLFSPSYIMETYSINYEELAKILRSNIHVRYPNECAKRWIGLSTILHTQYQDNPKEMFKGKSKYYEFKNAISKIKGFGQKTGGLLLRMLIDNDMLKPIDGIQEIPIDRHDIDLCIWLGIISGLTADEIKKSQKTIKLLSDTWIKAANNFYISPSLADQYLWIIGSEFCTLKNCVHCPINHLCNRKELCENEKGIYRCSDV